MMRETTLVFNVVVKIAIAEHAAIRLCAQIEPSTSPDNADRGTVHQVCTKHVKATRVNDSCWRCGNKNNTPENCLSSGKRVTDVIRSAMFKNGATPSENGQRMRKRRGLQ